MDKQKKSSEKTRYDSSSDSENEDEYKYEKNNDSAGIGGQLYETKLVCLSLLRALKDEKSEFQLGSNLAQIGAIDDIVVRFDYTDSNVKPKVLFIQAKHKDKITEIKEKDKINEMSIVNSNSIFNLAKYLKSYFLIVNRFNVESPDPVFRASFEDLDSQFIIYTCHQENFYRQNVKEVPENQLLKTSPYGKAMKFNNIEYEPGVDLINILLNSYRYDCAQYLAETFLNYLLKRNYLQMMNDNIIAAYHVYLKENIIEVSNTVLKDGNDFYRTFIFRNSFFTSNDYYIKVMRDTMARKITEDRNLSYSQKMSLLKSIPNRLPRQFGNFDIYITGNEVKHISRLLISLLNIADPTTYIVEFNDTKFGSQNIKEVDMKPHRIGGLVGNLLIMDYNTNMLKINTRNLPRKAYEVLQELKKVKGARFDFSKYRFDINVRCFSKFSLVHKMYDEFFVKTFLSKLTLYCNQAQDTDLNKLIKHELKDLYSGNNEYFRVKLDILFQNFHHRIQKWWRLRNCMPYYTKIKTKKLLEKCKVSVLDNPILSLVNYQYRNSLKKYSITFNKVAIHSLKYLNFTENYYITTNSVSLTSIKVLQYLTEKCNCSYLFLDLSYVMKEDYCDSVIRDISKTNVDLLICVVKKNENDELEKIKLVLKRFQGTIIVIAKIDVFTSIGGTDNFTHHNDINLISDLETCQDILQEKHFRFQGKQISLAVLLRDNNDLVKPYIVKKILNKEIIDIGKEIVYKNYMPVDHCYQNPLIDCSVILNRSKNLNKFHIIKKAENITNETEIDKEKDIIVFLKSAEELDVNSYKKFEDHNVHIFMETANEYFWEKTYGNLNSLYDIVKRLKPRDSLPSILNLKDTNKRRIIIAAEPGMGKSTFVESIVMATKEKYQDELILKIDVYDYRNCFEIWKNSDINLEEAIIFLFHVFSTHSVNDYKKLRSDLKLNLVENNVFLEFQNDFELNELVQFELHIFNQLYNDCKIAVLLDGCDEICPIYLQGLLKLLKIFDTTNISHLWVTTRNYNNVLMKLEETLHVFSHTLYEWSDSVQLNFLKKCFSKSFGVDSTDLNKYNFLEEYVQSFHKEISCKIMDNIRRTKFISIPLHISMIVKIYEDLLKLDFDKSIENSSKGKIKDLVDTLDLVRLYRKFIDVKFHNSYFVKRPWVDASDPLTKSSMQRDYEYFIEMHKKSAAYVLFSAYYVDFFTEEEELKINKFVNEVLSSDEKNGIIDEIIDGKPKFVHYSFSEYFAADFFCDKLKSKDYPEPHLQFFLDTVMVEKEYEVIRYFIDSNISTDTVLSHSYKHHMDKICDILLLQSFKDFCDTVVSVAIGMALKNVLFFVLHAVENNLNTFIKVIGHRNLSGCLLCTAAKMKYIDVIESITKTVLEHDKNKLIELFECEDFPENPFITTMNNVREDFEYTKVLEALILHLENDDVFNLFMKPFPPTNSICSFVPMKPDAVSIIMKHLKKFDKKQLYQLFSAQDTESGRTVAHIAVYCGAYELLCSIQELLGDELFVSFVSIVDCKGDTAIDIFDRMQANRLKSIYENQSSVATSD